MLHLHFSNRFEALSDQLMARLASEPRAIFAAAQLIVPSSAVRRALSLALADAHGVCANVEFGYLAQWLWLQMGRLVPGVQAQSPLAPPLLTWRIHKLLGEQAWVTGHPRLAAYLDGADALMRFELARQLAGLFDQYLTYRPEWLQAWAQGRSVALSAAAPDQTSNADLDPVWQAALWRRLTDDLGSAGELPTAAFVRALQQGGAALAALPGSAHIFVLPTMPPLHLSLLQQLGQRIELHIYAINPCREYWFELVDRRRLGRLAASGRDQGHESGHPLLSGWGQQAQAHIEGLVDAAGELGEDDEQYIDQTGDTLLARLQNSVLDMTPLAAGSITLAAQDRSVELHVCHSLTRELEVLHDHLLGLLDADPFLHASDILVVTPRLEEAAPLIDAVFGSVPDARRIPFTITGRARSRVNAPASTLLALLQLLGSRAGASELFALLQRPLVARRFGLDDAALARVHEWLRSAGLHWAVDAAHRASLGLPADARHSWADAQDRLMLGYALPDSVPEPFDLGEQLLLPAGSAEGGEAQTLGALWQAMDSLRALHAAMAAPQTPARWAALMDDALQRCIRVDARDSLELADLAELQAQVRELAQAMQAGAPDEPLPPAVWRAALQAQLDDPARGGVPTGGVSFSSMSSLRHLPYAVVCAIGLDDGAFPSAPRTIEFDLMARHPRRGDRQRRDDERNLFLDLLLAARRSLYLSHTGRGVRDNAPLPPSVLVTELLEQLVPAITEPPTGLPADAQAHARALAQARQRLVVEHPLQPFAAQAFEAGADPRLRSYNSELAQALRAGLGLAQAAAAEAALDGNAAHAGEMDDEDSDENSDEDSDDGRGAARDPGAIVLPFFGAPLAEPGPEWPAWQSPDLTQLVSFLRNPCRALLRQRLSLSLPRQPEELDDVEPLLPGALARRALAERLLPGLLGTQPGADRDTLCRLARAGTELPRGALGAGALERELDALTDFAQQVQRESAGACLAPQVIELDFDLDDEAWRLRASFADLRAGGLLRWRYAKLGAGDRLEAWVHHLMLCAGAPAGVQERTRWLASDGMLDLRAPADPKALLAELLRLYRLGHAQPLHFFPKAAWAFVDGGADLAAARKVWEPSDYTSWAEGDDPAYRLALRGRGPALNDQFCALAQAVFGPLKEHIDASD